MSDPDFPTAEEMKAKLIRNGFSAGAADGFVAIGETFRSDWAKAREDKHAVMEVFLEQKSRTDAYIKTQSEADQSAYDKFMNQCKTNIEQHP